MPRSSALLASFVMAPALIISCAILSHAGPLDPSSGPVAPSYKTLTSVEPRIEVNAQNTPGDGDSVYRITAPGSYYLSGNIAGTATKSCIKIAASRVTLDLNGFTLTGVGPGTACGVIAPVVQSSVTVKNGAVTNFGADGINVQFSRNCILTDLRCDLNAGSGISAGDNAIIERCTCSSNGSIGIQAYGTGSVVTGCTASGNASHGIYHGGAGTVQDCSSHDNTGDGIRNNGAATILNCSSWSNDGYGFYIVNSVITGCVAQSNGVDGFHSGGRCTIQQCQSFLSGANGFDLVGFGRITGCAANSNTLAGIHVTGPDNRIEGNNVVNNARGIDVDNAGNIIVRNTSAGNTFNYDVVIGNFGQYVNASSSGAVTGSSGGTPLGSTDPSVNFSY